MEKIRVLIVDDHAVVRQGISMIVSTEPAIEVVGEAKDGRDAIDRAENLQPDVVLMDLVMPQESGITALTTIKRKYPRVKVIVLTTFEDEERVQAAIEAGADGYLLKNADGEALLQAIYSVQRGEMPLHPRVAQQWFKGKREKISASGVGLTRREKEVLRLIARGWSNKEVAEVLKVREGTVKVHVSNILGKLNASSRTEAAIWATQVGLAPLNEQIH
jgi:DNA-binding NarL/FixJ family response regulator